VVSGSASRRRLRSGAGRRHRGAAGCWPAVAGSGWKRAVRPRRAMASLRVAETEIAEGLDGRILVELASHRPVSGCSPASGSEKTASKWRLTRLRCRRAPPALRRPVGKVHAAGERLRRLHRSAACASACRRRIAGGVPGGAGRRRLRAVLFAFAGRSIGARPAA
jgi:hypothetical protein